MPIQVLESNKKPSFGQKFSNAVGAGLQSGNQLMQQYQLQQQQAQEKEALRGLLGEEYANAPRDFQKMAYESKLKQQEQAEKLQGEENQLKILEDTFGKKFADIYKTSSEGGRTQLLSHALDALERGEDLAGILNYEQESNPNISSESTPEGPKKPKGITSKEWVKMKGEQLWTINQPIVKEMDTTRKNIALQEQAIADLEIAAPDVGIRDWLADTFEFEPLRSESGAKFKTGVKDFFLSDVSRVGARPNQWVEQQLMAALPVAGRTPESNLITVAGLKFKKDLSKKRAEIIDDLTTNYGYSEIDLGKTANKMMKSYTEERQKLLEDEIKSIHSRKKNLSGELLDVIGPNGEIYEIDRKEVEHLPEGFRLA